MHTEPDVVALVVSGTADRLVSLPSPEVCVLYFDLADGGYQTMHHSL